MARCDMASTSEYSATLDLWSPLTDGLARGWGPPLTAARLMTPTNVEVGRIMPQRFRHIVWWLALALAAATGWTALQPTLAPATLKAALTGGAALAAIFALGVAGLGLIRGRSPSLVVPGLAAVVLSVASLLYARQGSPQLAFLGVLNAVFAVGLLSRAVRLERTTPPPPDGEEAP